MGSWGVAEMSDRSGLALLEEERCSKSSDLVRGAVGLDILRPVGIPDRGAWHIADSCVVGGEPWRIREGTHNRDVP